ncbi:MAG: rhomboid family intramembrane serine protease [Myxococcales bacterium]
MKTEDPLGGLPGPRASEAEVAPARPRRERHHRIPATPTTVLLLAVIGAGFAAQLALGRHESESLAAFRLGSMTAAAVWHGDWYRLGSYAFLHGGAVHLLVNAWALWALMRPIEAALGPFAALGIFSGTAIGGGAVSFAWSTFRDRTFTSAVGASGGIFGLFGAHCAIYLRMRKYLPPEARRQAARPLVANLLINVALAVGAVAGGLPLDNAAHVGGFVSGMAFGAIAAVPALLPSRRWHRPATILFALFAFALAGMEGAAVARAARPQPRLLHGEGAEAVVPWNVLEIQEGVAATADRDVEVHLARLDQPVPGSTAGARVRLAGKEWRESDRRNDKGISFIELIEPSSRLVVRVFCWPDDCADADRQLAEEIASGARATRPP